MRVCSPVAVVGEMEAENVVDGDADVEPPYAQRPDSLRRLRACKGCKLIKTYEQVRAMLRDAR